MSKSYVASGKVQYLKFQWHFDYSCASSYQEYQYLYQAALWRGFGDCSEIYERIQNPFIHKREGKLDQGTSAASQRTRTKQRFTKNTGRPQCTQKQKEWLKERICFYARKWEPVMGVHCERWTIRDMTSRWGSCSVQKHTIRINLQLAKKPEKCLEYVIVHELTHLLEPSHNQRFHAYMKKFLPDYKEREKRLRGDI